MLPWFLAVVVGVVGGFVLDRWQCPLCGRWLQHTLLCERRAL